MKSIKFAACIAIPVLACTTAYAGDEQSFSALQGVEAQALSSPEMSSVYGQAITFADLVAAIEKVPCETVENALLSVVNNPANAATINKILSFLNAPH